MIFLQAWVFISFFISSALAQAPTVAGVTFNFTTIDPALCVAPSAYLTCYAEAVKGTAECMQIAGNSVEAQSGCGCADSFQKINCFASACWNKVYGCEYQAFVAGYFSTCDIATTPVPYWPAPANAPGRCSCNLGDVFGTIVESEERLLVCYKNTIGSPTVLSQMRNCDCCASSVTISALFDICPDTDPNLIGLNQILGFDNSLNVPWSSCGSILAGVDCVNSLSFPPPLGTGTFYNPTNTPAAGTKTLSNIAGEVTLPASGSSFVWYQGTIPLTVIAATGSEVTTTASGAVIVNSGNGGSTATGKSGGITANSPGIAVTSSGTTSVSTQPQSTSNLGSSGSGNSGGSVKGTAPCWDANILIHIAAATILGLLLGL